MAPSAAESYAQPQGEAMEIRVLGQLEVWRGSTRVSLGSFKQRGLLALLLMHANRPVSTDRIIDELWSDETAGDRHNALWVQVSKLRARLEPDREHRPEGHVLVTREHGYSVCVGPDELDAERMDMRRAAPKWEPIK